MVAAHSNGVSTTNGRLTSTTALSEDEDDDAALLGEPSSSSSSKIIAKWVQDEHQPMAQSTHGPAQLWRTYGLPGIYIAVWYSTSLSLSIYNKFVFGKAHINFAFPLFTSACHMLVQLFLSVCSVALIWKKLRPTRFPSMRDYLLKVLPCAVATGLDIGLSNSSLKTISLSFYTMVKSGAPVFVLLFAFLFGLERPTWRLTGIIAVICLGVLLMVMHETNFEPFGYAEIQLATVLSGFRWSLTTILLERESMGMSNPFATSIFLAPLMAISLFIASITIENFFVMLPRSPLLATPSSALIMVGLILVGGLIAFVMVIAEFKLISVTSVVTFSVAGIVKEIITIVASAIVFHDTFTATNIAGLIISIIGIAMYNYARILGIREGGGHGHGHGGVGRTSGAMTTAPSSEPLSPQEVGLMDDAFFDVDIDIEDDPYEGAMGERAVFATRSAFYGYHPMSSFVNLQRGSFRDGATGSGRVLGDGIYNSNTELDHFYPVEDVAADEDDARRSRDATNDGDDGSHV